MQPQRLSASELVALGGSALVAVGLFLPWYSPNDNPYANSQGRAEGPGDPSGPISLAPGFSMALVGALAMIGGSVLRSAKSGRRRRPPGVL
ncbi:MAG TPA: hypothetical protein VGV40_06505 [Solirubrobacteraceae bacterium]|nr:hypothetical protein [Solirubrobacteraceae bacterium]